jgi:hypothetical protein
MNLQNRMARLEQVFLNAGGASDDAARCQRRCELLLELAETDAERAKLLQCIWEIEHGFYTRWREAEVRARPVPWREMNHDERAAENSQRLLSERDFVHINPERPQIPANDMQELRRRYGKK